MTDSIQDKPFTVQAGKRYVRRDGKISGTLVLRKRLVNKNYPFEDDGTPRIYCNNGGYWESGSTSPLDLISEYIEPTVGDTMMASDDGIYDEAVLGEMYPPIKTHGFSTAEPQDEWGPWIGWNGGECPAVGKNTDVVWLYHDGETTHEMLTNTQPYGWDNKNLPYIIAYRIKKEPEVLTKNVWISEITACVLTTPTPDYQTRRAIITLTDGKLDIEWAD